MSRGVAAAVGIGLLVRLLFAFGYWVDKPLTHDEQEYLHLAQNVAAGRGLTYDASAAGEPDVERFGRAPLYPLLLSLIARVAPTAHLLAAIRVAQSILGAVAIVVARVRGASGRPVPLRARSRRGLPRCIHLWCGCLLTSCPNLFICRSHSETSCCVGAA